MPSLYKVVRADLLNADLLGWLTAEFSDADERRWQVHAIH